MSILAVDRRRWSHPRKIEARQRSVIDAYREATGLQSVPSARQYWSLCGQLFDSTTRKMQPGCEFEHLISNGLICRGQFHGVEASADIHAGNVSALPGIHLHRGDMADILYRELGAGRFYPGLINLDTTSEPERAVRLLCDVMDVVNHVDGPVVVVWNVILRCRISNRRFTWEDITAALGFSDRFSTYVRHGWSQTSSLATYEYWTRATRMGTTVIIRNGRAICQPLV